MTGDLGDDRRARCMTPGLLCLFVMLGLGCESPRAPSGGGPSPRVTPVGRSIPPPAPLQLADFEGLWSAYSAYHEVLHELELHGDGVFRLEFRGGGGAGGGGMSLGSVHTVWHGNASIADGRLHLAFQPPGEETIYSVSEPRLTKRPVNRPPARFAQGLVAGTWPAPVPPQPWPDLPAFKPSQLLLMAEGSRNRWCRGGYNDPNQALEVFRRHAPRPDEVQARPELARFHNPTPEELARFPPFCPPLPLIVSWAWASPDAPKSPPATPSPSRRPALAPPRLNDLAGVWSADSGMGDWNRLELESGGAFRLESEGGQGGGAGRRGPGRFVWYGTASFREGRVHLEFQPGKRIAADLSGRPQAVKVLPSEFAEGLVAGTWPAPVRGYPPPPAPAANQVLLMPSWLRDSWCRGDFRPRWEQALARQSATPADLERFPPLCPPIPPG
jgi:hypothetical protein